MMARYINLRDVGDDERDSHMLKFSRIWISVLLAYEFMLCSL